MTGLPGAVAYDRRTGGDTDLYVVADAVERRLPVSAPGVSDSRPAWAAPAAQGIATLQSPSGGDPEAAPGAIVDIAVSGPVPRPITAVSFNGLRGAFTVAGVNAFTFNISATVPPGATSGPVCVSRSAGFQAAPALEQTVVAGVLRVPGTATGQRPGCRPSQPLAFQSNRGGDYDIWAANETAATPVPLVAWRGTNETQPAWSGTSELTIPNDVDVPLLAYVSDRGGDREVWIFDAGQPVREGVNPAPLTSSPADDANPDFSATGRHLAFQSDRDGQTDIWTMELKRDASGRFVAEEGLRKLTEDEPPSYDPSWFHFGLNENPTSAIAFGGPEPDGACAINYTVWPAGDGDRPPAPGQAATWTVDDAGLGADGPAWSPYGDALSYQRRTSQGAALLQIRTTDGPSAVPVPLPGVSGTPRHPAWQALPYSAQIAYFRPLGRQHPRRRRAIRREQGGIDPIMRTSLQAGAAPCAEPPSAQLRLRPESPRVGQNVTFDATASEAIGGTIDRYEWDLDGDGSYEQRGAQASVTTRLTGPERRTVTVRITDDDGATDVARLAVTPGEDSEGRCTKSGTAGPDRLRGTARRDVLCGLGGDDLILGLGADDVLLGGAGNDRLFGGRGADRLRGQRGRDFLAGARGGDRLWGGTGPDRLVGEGGPDFLLGDAGTDAILGGAQADVLVGGAGRDDLRGGPGRDMLRARDGQRDRLDGGPQRDRAVVDGPLERIRGVEAVRLGTPSRVRTTPR